MDETSQLMRMMLRMISDEDCMIALEAAEQISRFWVELLPQLYFVLTELFTYNCTS